MCCSASVRSSVHGREDRVLHEAVRRIGSGLQGGRSARVGGLCRVLLDGFLDEIHHALDVGESERPVREGVLRQVLTISPTISLSHDTSPA
jgi:ABC-type uncharacterized transport system YnjBCD ATPase subunit